MTSQLGFGLLVGQNELFEDNTLGSGKCFAFFYFFETFYGLNDQSINHENKQQINQ